MDQVALMPKPRYYEDLLSPKDKNEYDLLQETFHSKNCRNNRNQRLQKFSEMLSSIQSYCLQPLDESNNWKRCLVCGVAWIKSGLAVNIRQLTILLDKCKSSINGSLQRANYRVINGCTEELSEAIPIMKGNFNELREWTVRELSTSTPQPIIPTLNQSVPLKMATSPSPEIPNTNMFEFSGRDLTPSEDEFFQDPLALVPQFIANECQQNLSENFTSLPWDI